MQYPYSGSDDELPENSNVAGQPSSILHAPGENTLRKNFAAIQEHNKAVAAREAQAAAAAAAAAANGRGGGGHPQFGMPGGGQPVAAERQNKDRRSSRKEEVPQEPGPPSR